MTGIPTTNATADGKGIYQGWTDLSQNKVTGQMEDQLKILWDYLTKIVPISKN